MHLKNVSTDPLSYSMAPPTPARKITMISAPHQSLMEVTGALSSCARGAGFNFGADTALVAVQHMLYQTVDLFRALGEIGLKPENIFALGKVYSNSPPVIAAIRKTGATVVDSTFPKPGEFEETFERDVERLWKTVAEALGQRRISRIIVLDDGGRCIINIPLDLLSRYPVAGVEQTSRGMVVFEEHPPPFAVFAWARTAVKLQIGGHVFSHSLIDRVQARFLRGQPLNGADVGIIGLGSVGRALADIAVRQDNNVAFYDPAPDLKVPHYLRGRITRLDSLEELMLHGEYVIGASGRNPFDDTWPMAHRPGTTLFSASGGDREFGPILRFVRQRPTFKVAGRAWDVTSDHGPSGPIRIAYLGFPYNFVSRAEAAVPTHIVQLETGGLLAGLIQARTYLELIEHGHETDTRIHRISPDAQEFICAMWVWALKNRGIDILNLYNYDLALLTATQHSGWFVENTEPRSIPGPGPGERVEDMMKAIVAECCQPAH